MAPKLATRRLQKEFKALHADPPPGIAARPSESNILEWHYLLEGPPETPYLGGVYHGKLVFKPEYPHKPPAISMLTPSGRFKTGTSLCFSMSEYHPESWQPSWSVATILLGLQSFMAEEAVTQGSIAATDAERRKFAAEAAAHCRQSASFKRHFADLLPLMAERQAAWEEGGAEGGAGVRLNMRSGDNAGGGDGGEQAEGGGGDSGGSAGVEEERLSESDAGAQEAAGDGDGGSVGGAQAAVAVRGEAKAPAGASNASGNKVASASADPDASWSVKKLRAYITGKGGSAKGCREKGDLLVRAQALSLDD